MGICASDSGFVEFVISVFLFISPKLSTLNRNFGLGFVAGPPSKKSPLLEGMRVALFSGLGFGFRV